MFHPSERVSMLDKNRMIQAYRNISFHMEERGESDFKYYTSILEKDLELLGKKLNEVDNETA